MNKLPEAVTALLNTVPLSRLRGAAQLLSDKYRAARTGQSLALTSEEEALAYLATRFPGTFAAGARVLAEIPNRLPSFAPATVLDFGAGPGTLSGAAGLIWPDSQYTAFEPNPYMRALAAQLGVSTNANPPHGPYDLVMAGYVLNETPDPDKLAQFLWSLTQQVLVIIEPGTQAGFAILARVREILLKDGAYMLAPCPHAHACPLQGHDTRWCHFTARIARSKLHKSLTQNATLGYEDEAFAYLIVSRVLVALPQDRLVGRVRGEKVKNVEVCAHTGHIASITASKRDAAFKALKKAQWGDAWTAENF